jgi:hypothetical protein
MRFNRTRRVGWLPLAGLVLAAFVLGGCSIGRFVQPVEDALATWSDHPLPPDAALTAKAVSDQASCVADPGPIHVLIQDRRTQFSAAFLFSAPNAFGSCFVTSGGGGMSGGSGPPPGPMAGPISIDDNGAGSLGGGEVRSLGGRVLNTASRVVVQLVDGRSVVASLNNGYWLAWWPDTTLASKVVASDTSGAAIGTVEVAG